MEEAATGKAGPTKSPQVQKYLDHASYCSHMAAMAWDGDTASQLAETAMQWRYLAKHIEQTEKEQANQSQVKMAANKSR